MSDWVMIVAGGILQQPAVRVAKELGYRVLVTDRDPNCACASLADHFIEMDTFDTESHVALAKLIEPAAVFTAGADPIVTVAYASAFDDSYNRLNVEVAETCADKSKTRDALALCGVPQPKYTKVYSWMSEASIVRLIEDSFRAVIIKATGSSGSRGHTRLDLEKVQEGEFEAAIKRANEFSKDVPLLEEMLTGIELSVETLWYDGTMIPLNAVERPFMDHPEYAIELGHYNPWNGGVQDYDAVWHVAEMAGQAVGMAAQQGGHIFKVDMMLTADGPKVLECTTRLSGGFDSGWTTPLAHGSDYTKGALLLALGEPLHVAMPYFAKRWARHAACMAVFGPPEGGIIKEIKGLDRARSLPTLSDVILRFNVGDELPALADCGSRVVFCIGDAKEKDPARRDAIRAAGRIEVVCE